MADLYINLLEKITLGDVDRSVNTIQTISNISYIDNRIFQLPSGSVTTIFSTIELFKILSLEEFVIMFLMSTNAFFTSSLTLPSGFFN